MKAEEYLNDLLKTPDGIAKLVAGVNEDSDIPAIIALLMEATIYVIEISSRNNEHKSDTFHYIASQFTDAAMKKDKEISSNGTPTKNPS